MHKKLHVLLVFIDESLIVVAYDASMDQIEIEGKPLCLAHFLSLSAVSIRP